MQDRTFKSKTDTRFYAVTFATCGLMVFISVYPRFSWLALFLTYLVCMLLLDITFNTAYTVSGTRLTITCGIFFRQDIDIRCIRSVVPVHSLLGSPAMSADRLLLHGEGFDDVLVSPREKKAFADCLLAVNPDIEVGLPGCETDDMRQPLAM